LSVPLGKRSPTLIAITNLRRWLEVCQVFFVVEARSAHPMLPLAMFRSRNFSGANLLTLFLYTALVAGCFSFRSI
jgi:hypothetical protein